RLPNRKCTRWGPGRDHAALDRDKPGCRDEEDEQEAGGGKHSRDARRAALAEGEADRRDQADDQQRRLKTVDPSKGVREGGLEVRQVGVAPSRNALPRDRDDTTGEE